jgi:hypothetical protein
MKKIITFAIIILVSIVVQLIPFLPWWSFLVPIFLMGVVLPLERWKIPPFLMGFIAGFLVWSLATLYFETIYKGEIMSKISKIIAVPDYLIYGIIGFIGGILTGLSLYSGFLLRRGKEILCLELPKA